MIDTVVIALFSFSFAFSCITPYYEYFELSKVDILQMVSVANSLLGLLIIVVYFNTKHDISIHDKEIKLYQDEKYYEYVEEINATITKLFKYNSNLKQKIKKLEKRQMDMKNIEYAIAYFVCERNLKKHPGYADTLSTYIRDGKYMISDLEEKADNIHDKVITDWNNSQ